MIFNIIRIFKEYDILNYLFETLYMVGVSTLLAYLVGLLIGIMFVFTDKNGLSENKYINKITGLIVNIGRSIPFIIFAVAITPLTRFIVGKTYGETAAIIPLTLSAIPFVSRLTESTLKEINISLIETTKVMGASNYSIIKNVYLKESFPQIIRNFAITTINILGYSAMVGSLGSGGLGKLAINEGFNNFNYKVVFITVIIIVCLVQAIQISLETLAKKIDKK